MKINETRNQCTIEMIRILCFLIIITLTVMVDGVSGRGVGRGGNNASGHGVAELLMRPVANKRPRGIEPSREAGGGGGVI